MDGHFRCGCVRPLPPAPYIFAHRPRLIPNRAPTAVTAALMKNTSSHQVPREESVSVMCQDILQDGGKVGSWTFSNLSQHVNVRQNSA